MVSSSGYEPPAHIMSTPYRGPGIGGAQPDSEEIKRRLEQAELSFKALFDNSNDAILLVNRTTMKVVDANLRASQVLGYDRAELVQLAVEQLTPPTDASTGRSLGEGLRLAVGDFTARVATKRRAVVDVAVTAWTVDLPGLPVVFALLRDLTRQKQFERELMLSARRMRQLFDVSPTMTHVLDILEDGLRLSWISENVKRILGYTPEEILADPTWWHRGIHPDDQAHALQTNDEVLSKGAARVEYRFRHSDGSYHWTQEELRLVTDDDGTPVEVVGSWADITDKKTAEAAFIEGERRLRESQRMEAIANLAGGIAHDFNNLLTTISGYANLLLEESDHPEPDLEEIRTAAERGAELVRQLLAFSRRQTVRPEPIDLNEVIVRLERVLGRMIGVDITLHTVLEPDLWLTEADSAQIEQIVLNLASNSRDATGEGGHITLGTANVYLGPHYRQLDPEFRPGRYVSLSVTDTGRGMPPEVRKRAFEPFFTTKPQGKGTGLGLSTVYGMAKQSGGHVIVDSAEGAGTRVEVFLPRFGSGTETDDDSPLPIPATPDRTETGARGEATAPETSGGTATGRHRATPPHRPSDDSNHETLLVVEDEPSVRRYASHILRGIGYTVLEAGCAEEAFAAADGHEGVISLLLTDVVLPGPGGRAVADSLVQSRPGLRVLYMSGYAKDSIVHDGRVEPGISLLPKPFSATALASAVREALDSPRG